jgi:hypothetical protein
MGSRGNRGDTQGKPYRVAREILTGAYKIATGGYKGNRSSIGSVRESELLIVPLTSQGQQNLEGGKGQCLHHVSKGEKERRLQ